MALTIKPTEGHVALNFLDSPDESSEVGEPESDKAVLAIVVGAGAKTGVKAGDTVFVRRYAMTSGVEIDDSTRIVSSYAIVATVTGK